MRSWLLRFRLATVVLVIMGVLTPLCDAAAAPAAGVGAAPDFPPAIVRCDPSYAQGFTDGTVSVDLYLEDTQNTYGIDVQVTFDSTIATVADQNSGAPGTQIAPLYSWFTPSFMISNVACNPGDPSSFGCSSPADVGSIWFAATQLNPTPAVNGSGPFARVTFQPLTFGTFTMHFFYHKLSDPGGVEVPSTSQDCTIRFLSPLAVTLARFDASVRADHVAVSWETVSETRHAGFNVLRAENPDGPWTRRNPNLIVASTPGASSGAAYTWLDREIEVGATYWYLLEDVDLDGVATPHGPVRVTTQTPNAVMISRFAGRPARDGSLAPLALLALLIFAPFGQWVIKRTRG